MRDGFLCMTGGFWKRECNKVLREFVYLEWPCFQGRNFANQAYEEILMIKLVLSAFICALPVLISAQPTIKNPHICNDASGRFSNYFDGHFNIMYKDGRFDKWNTQDSQVRFYEEDRSLQLFTGEGMNLLKISTTDEGIQFVFKQQVTVVKDSTAKDFTINGINFLVTATNWSCTIQTQVGPYSIKLGFNKFVKNWKWDKVFIRKDAISLYTGYNCYHYAGPESHIIQDDNAQYGTSISNTFKSRKYIWWISPVYYKDRTATRYPDFDFFYSARGILKRSKSFGLIQTCSTE